MNRPIHALTKQHAEEASVHNVHVLLRRVEGVAQRVAHEERVSPVVDAVLEEVCERHRTVRELVNEKGFKETLRVMEDPGDHSESTRKRNRTTLQGLLRVFLCARTINEGRAQVENNHDDQRTQVLVHKHLYVTQEQKEDIAITNLRSHITQNDVCIECNVVFSKRLLVVDKTQRLLIRRYRLQRLTHFDEMA